MPWRLAPVGGMGSSERGMNEGLEFQTTLMYALGEG